MRITCPTCSAQYDVEDSDISFNGQDVQCSDCLTVWTQTRTGEVSNARAADALAEPADGNEEIGQEITPESDDFIDPFEDAEDTASAEDDEISAALETDDTDEEETDAVISDALDFEDPFDDDESVDDSEDEIEAFEEEDEEIEPEESQKEFNVDEKELAAELDGDAETDDAHVTFESFEDDAETDLEDPTDETAIEDTDSTDDVEAEPSAEEFIDPFEVSTDFEDLETDSDDSDDNEALASETNQVETETSDTEESDEEENPIWKEIAEIARAANEDSKVEPVVDEEYTPPDDMPPIQDAPAVPEQPHLSVVASEEDERPWDAAVETEEEFSDFVWSDPSKVEEDEEDDFSLSAISDAIAEDDNENGGTIDEKPPAKVSELATISDVPAGELEEMDDDALSAALKEQMAIEEELEKSPHTTNPNARDIPVELGGLRSREPNVDALKDSVRSKSVELSKDEQKIQRKPLRFRRGFALTFLLFVILGAIYISTGPIISYLPAAEPYLEIYVSFIDILRVQAEAFAIIVWDLTLQGFDWVMSKING